ncbi:zinc finger with UFM1-specific peptidase domain protein isoform X2 [Arapaima gigas]
MASRLSRALANIPTSFAAGTSLYRLSVLRVSDKGKCVKKETVSSPLFVMLTCEICGEEVLLEADMRTHLLLSHLEKEQSCPLCSLAGVTYDELRFHINIAHSESDQQLPGKQNTVEESKGQACASASRSSTGTASELAMSVCSSSGRQSHGGDAGQPRVKHGPFWPLFPTSENTCIQPFQEAKAEILMMTSHKAIKGDSTEQKLRTSPQKEFSCPMCALVCSDCFVLQEHVELHLEEQNMTKDFQTDLQLARQLQEEEDVKRKQQESKLEAEDFKNLQKQFGMDGRGGYRRQVAICMERAVSRGHMSPLEFHRKRAEMMECLASGIDDGKSKTSGLITALYEYYLRDGRDITNVWLSAETDHYSFSEGDRGWGCGYRNFQMLLSSLLKLELYRDCFTERTVPNIPRVQALIEEAWHEGADPQGASQFKHHLQGTRAWIGATEIYSLLTSLKVRARIVDFHQPTGPGSTHPRLFEWVKKYFSTSSSRGARLPPRVVKSTQPPIYLQHQGHSRSIVGIEQKKNGSLCLLIFDPGCPVEDMRHFLIREVNSTSMRLLRKFPSHLKHRQYQIVSIEGVLSPEEKQVRIETSKILHAERIP